MRLVQTFGFLNWFDRFTPVRWQNDPESLENRLDPWLRVFSDSTDGPVWFLYIVATILREIGAWDPLGEEHLDTNVIIALDDNTTTRNEALNHLASNLSSQAHFPVVAISLLASTPVLVDGGKPSDFHILLPLVSCRRRAFSH